MFSQYGARAATTLPGEKQECPGNDFESIVQLAYKTNGPVFACMLVRALVFSEAQFAFRRRRNGRPGSLFGTNALAPLESPWQGGTTGSLLKQAIQYADLAGNSYTARRAGGKLMPLRPDWVDIVIGSPHDDEIGAWDVDSEVLGYVYTPGGRHSGRPSVPFLANEVAHWAPIPDPEAQFRGMSWLTPVVREVMSDKAATQHKLGFFENAATPNMVIKIETDDLEKYKSWISVFRDNQEGARNAYKTMFLASGADASVVGSNLEQMDFKAVQGAGETRIAAAARVPPIIVGLSEGLESATYSNYGQARRAFADATLRPLWRDFCGALATIVDVPSDAELWYDESGIAFLREDQKDAAQIMALNAVSVSQFVINGFDPDSAVEAVDSGDLTRLKHSGLTSVQLHPPGEVPPEPSPRPLKQATPSTALEQIQDILQLTAGSEQTDDDGKPSTK